MKKKIIIVFLILILILISIIKVNVEKIYNRFNNLNAEIVQGFNITEFLVKDELHILVTVEDDLYGISQVEYPEKEMILYGNGKNKIAFDVDVTDITKTYYFTYTNGNNEKVVKAYKFESKNEFDYTGDMQIFVAKTSGTYKIQLWGSQGGSRYNNGGKGGYSEGELNLTENQILYVYVGACPNYNAIWNGGGYSNYSGGDATDIRINGKTLSNRIIVAGGGGGTGLGPNSAYQYVGGAGRRPYRVKWYGTILLYWLWRNTNIWRIKRKPSIKWLV